jgi:lipoprotein-anchoring transpeptidase ErfK/SrfK
VCQSAVELSGAAPIEASATRLPTPASPGLPFRYFFVGPSGAAAYSRAETAELDEPVLELQGGFAVAITAERSVNGARYGRTGHALWVPIRDLVPIRPFSFHGEWLQPPTTDPPSIPVAWILSDQAPVLARPGGPKTAATRARQDAIRVLNEETNGAGTFLRIGDNAWVAGSDVRHPRWSEPPPEVDADADERWIDVDLDTQTLVAYEGHRAVFATLVSTGKGRPGTPTATPKGSFRIWSKLTSSDMDNLEDDAASHYYRMEDVPYVQYFSKGVGIHGAFWHHSFGRVRSHGCVNLAPVDAEQLFAWTGPHLPAGWTAALSMGHDRGTVVRVR